MFTTEEILKALKEPLKIEDVDFRVQSITASGWATVISYKNARVDANRLDEVCGGIWQNDFKLIDNKMYGGIGIKLNDEWMWRWDVGTESNQDKEKGQASDAFKRAGFKWGIGRELYDYPLILVKLNEDEFTVTDYQGKKSAKQTNKLRIRDWKWTAEFNDRGIPTKLAAHDEKNLLRYSFPRSGNQPASPATQSQAPKPAATIPQENKPDATKDQDKAAKKPPTEAEKKWLNVTDGKHNFTPEWQNLQRAILDRKIKSIDDVLVWYKVSKDVAPKIEELLQNQTVKS